MRNMQRKQQDDELNTLVHTIHDQEIQDIIATAQDLFDKKEYIECIEYIKTRAKFLPHIITLLYPLLLLAAENPEIATEAKKLLNMRER